MEAIRVWNTKFVQQFITFVHMRSATLISYFFMTVLLGSVLFTIGFGWLGEEGLFDEPEMVFVWLLISGVVSGLAGLPTLFVLVFFTMLRRRKGIAAGQLFREQAFLHLICAMLTGLVGLFVAEFKWYMPMCFLPALCYPSVAAALWWRGYVKRQEDFLVPRQVPVDVLDSDEIP